MVRTDTAPNSLTRSITCCTRISGGRAVTPMRWRPANHSGWIECAPSIRYAHALALGHFAQTVGVRAVRAADHQHQIAIRRQDLDRVLAVLRGVADVALLWFDDIGKARLERLRHGGRVIHRQRGLRDIGQVVGIGHLQAGHVLDGLDQVHAALRLPQRALDFRMTLWPIMMISRPAARGRPRYAPWSPAGRWRRTPAGHGRRLRRARPVTRRGPRTPR